MNQDENKGSPDASGATAENDGRPLTKDELARYYGVEKRTVENWMSKRLVPYIKIGKTVRFYRTDVDAALKRRFGIGYRLVETVRLRTRANETGKNHITQPSTTPSVQVAAPDET